MRDDTQHELITAYLDRELSEPEYARVERLLDSDPHCARLRDELQAMSVALQSLPRYTAPAYLWDNILKRLSDPAVLRSFSGDTEPPRPRNLAHSQRRRSSYWALAAGSLAAAVLVMILIPWANQPNRQPDVARTNNETRPAPVPQPGPEQVGENRTEEDSPPQAQDQRSDASALARTGREREVPPVPEAGETALAAVSDQPSRAARRELMLLVDVGLRPSAMPDAFLQALVAAGIRLDSALGVDQALEQALLESRFVRKQPNPANQPPAAAPPQLFFVTGTTKQIDEVITHLLIAPDRVASVQFDLAARPGDDELFRELRRASSAQFAESGSEGSSVGIAQQLALSMSLEQFLARNFLYLAYTPDTQDTQMASAQPEPPPVAGETPVYSVLFVLHEAR